MINDVLILILQQYLLKLILAKYLIRVSLYLKFYFTRNRIVMIKNLLNIKVFEITN